MEIGRDAVENSAQFLGPAALGMAAGLLVGERLSRGGREAVSILCLTVGLAAAAPFMMRQIHRQLHAPGTDRGSRRIQAALRGGEFFEDAAADTVQQAG